MIWPSAAKEFHVNRSLAQIISFEKRRFKKWFQIPTIWDVKRRARADA